MDTPIWPSGSLLSITPSDVTTFSPLVRQVYVGTAGNLVVLTASDQTITFSNLPAGALIGPFFIKKVLAATTAGSLVGFQ